MENEYSNEHRAILELLPWYANNTLPEHERQLLHTHLHDCIACRSELKRFFILQECLQDYENETLGSQAFEELMVRIETAEANLNSNKLKNIFFYPVRVWNEISSLSLKWVVAVQFAILVLCGFVFLQPLPADPQGGYKTLSSSQINSLASQKLRVVFSETSQEKNIRQILKSIDANIIAGPTRKGVYTLSLSGNNQSVDEDIAVILAKIRSYEQVEFAEPVITND